MSFSPNPVFLDESLDDPFEFLVEQESSHLISEETTSSIFDILPSTPTGQSFNAGLLEDIDLDLQCEDDDVDDTANESLDELFNQTLQKVYSNYKKVTPQENAEIGRQTVLKENRSVTSEEVKTHRNLALNPDHQSTANDTEQTSLTLSNFRTNDQLKLPAEPVRSVSCTVCSIQFSNQETLLAHNEDKHVHKRESIVNACIVCGIVFQNRKTVIKHMKNAHKESQHQPESGTLKHKQTTVYQCHICSYRGKTKTLLQNHTKAKHDPNRAVLHCDQCDFTCVQERTLILHAQRHEGDPKFACDQCGKLYTTMSILKRHAHTHNKIRAFACVIPGCDKTFNIKSRLTDHMRRVHRHQIKPSKISSAVECHETSSTIVTNECKSSAVSDENHLHSKFSSVSSRNSSYSKEVLLDHDKASVLPVTDGSSSNGNVCVYDVILRDEQIERFNSKTDQVNIPIDTALHPAHGKGTCIRGCCKAFSQISPDIDQQMTDTHSHLHGNLLVSNSTSSKVSLGAAVETTCKMKTYEGLVSAAARNAHQKCQVKKFTCGWEGCGNKFRDSYNLRLHMCTHTGETQRACQLCRYRCVQKSAMDAHMKTHRKPMSDG